MDFPIDEKTKKKYIPDWYEGTIEDRFKNLPKESELKGNKKEEDQLKEDQLKKEELVNEVSDETQKPLKKKESKKKK